MWGFQSHGVIPDIVTMAKGIANGFPMGAIVTKPGEFYRQSAARTYIHIHLHNSTRLPQGSSQRPRRGEITSVHDCTDCQSIKLITSIVQEHGLRKLKLSPS